ncbi:MAG: glutamine--tRNA ligase/YqeY domain fusion protein [Halobacteriovoraceae bacterium]|nr:glutamine--tRNA ligase/YqeY domain fusion protein [Halobacteriovoraceae bacterium]
MSESEETQTEKPLHFIRQQIADDNKSGKYGGQVCTRFPPEPNGFLHIGHAKAILLSYGMASENHGAFHLRFDDTNPEKESDEYVHAIKKDISWIGADWGANLFFASDYFEKLYQFAVELIKKGSAYVCDLSAEDLRRYRGNLTEPGRNSPNRDRSVEENLALFSGMRAGEFEDGSKSLRAKIDMASPNMNLRDPALYRIRRVHHHRTGDKWCIYPIYDFTHGLSDSIEGITHSLCSLEFADHRPLYDWFLDQLAVHHPLQMEFSKLRLENTVMGKRHMLRMVNDKIVNGWDDPRMPTISGMRRRGFTPEGIANFCEQVGVTKKESVITLVTLESCIRDDLNKVAPRRLGVLNPLKVVISNWEEGKVQEIEVPNHPGDESFGSRKMALTKEIYIEQEDFMENPPNNKYRRLKPDGMVRLRYGHVIQCDEIIRDEKTSGIKELHCSLIEGTFAGETPEGMKKVKGIIGWVSADKSLEVEVRLYDRLFTKANPMADKEIDYIEYLNPDSLEIIQGARVEASLADSVVDQKFQFERLGYFRVDEDSTKDKKVFNRAMTLRDNWANK